MMVGWCHSTHNESLCEIGSFGAISENASLRDSNKGVVARPVSQRTSRSVDPSRVDCSLTCEQSSNSSAQSPPWRRNAFPTATSAS
jgi:hypothetical protein